MEKEKCTSLGKGVNALPKDVRLCEEAYSFGQSHMSLPKVVCLWEKYAFGKVKCTSLGKGVNALPKDVRL